MKRMKNLQKVRCLLNVMRLASMVKPCTKMDYISLKRGNEMLLDEMKKTKYNLRNIREIETEIVRLEIILDKYPSVTYPTTEEILKELEELDRLGEDV